MREFLLTLLRWVGIWALLALGLCVVSCIWYWPQVSEIVKNGVSEIFSQTGNLVLTVVIILFFVFMMVRIFGR